MSWIFLDFGFGIMANTCSLLVMPLYCWLKISMRYMREKREPSMSDGMQFDWLMEWNWINREEQFTLRRFRLD